MSTTYLIVEVDSVDEWRVAAWAAARRRGWKVRTGVGQTGQQVYAVQVDAEAEKAWSGCY